MDNTIERYHWFLEKTQYLSHIANGHFKNTWSDSLSYEKVPRQDMTYEALVTMMRRVGFGWENKSNNKVTLLSERLKHDRTELFRLKHEHEEIGFSLHATPSFQLPQQFYNCAHGLKVREIEALGLYRGQAGAGRGRSFFEMFFQKIFCDYDAVYWTQSSSNHPGLYKFYERMGMQHIATTIEPAFRDIEAA